MRTRLAVIALSVIVFSILDIAFGVMATILAAVMGVMFGISNFQQTISWTIGTAGFSIANFVTFYLAKNYKITFKEAAKISHLFGICCVLVAPLFFYSN